MAKKKIYTISSVEHYIKEFLKLDGAEGYQFDEGVLGLGSWILTAPGKKTVIIKEVALSSWSSGQMVTCYNRIPLKYQRILDEKI